MGTVVCGAVEKTVQLWITLWLFHKGVWPFFSRRQADKPGFSTISTALLLRLLLSYTAFVMLKNWEGGCLLIAQGGQRSALCFLQRTPQGKPKRRKKRKMAAPGAGILKGAPLSGGPGAGPRPVPSSGRTMSGGWTGHFSRRRQLAGRWVFVLYPQALWLYDGREEKIVQTQGRGSVDVCMDHKSA